MRRLIIGLGAIFMIVGVMGFALIASQTIPVSAPVPDSSDIIVPPMDSEALAEDLAVTDKLLNTPNLISSSATLARVDLGSGNRDDVQIVFYDLDIGQGKTRSAFRIYNHENSLIYEDESSVWSATPILWQYVQSADVDNDGDPELIIGGKQGWRPPCLLREIFDYEPHVGFQLVNIPDKECN